MQTLLVDIIFFAVVGAVFLIALTRPQKRDEKG
jgi:preprotein translocase subunit YajC